MDCEHCRNVVSKASVQLLEEDVSKRAISRSSSMGCSSRVYYYYRRPEGGVPFNWEMKPGTPKHPPIADTIPPLTPPPALLSRRLPKPTISVEDPKPSFFLKLKLWKHLHCRKCISGWTNKKIVGRHKNDHSASNNDYYNNDDFSGRYGPDICSSSSSCSSSPSFSANNSSRSSKDGSLFRGSGEGFHGCTPWDFGNFGAFSR